VGSANSFEPGPFEAAYHFTVVFTEPLVQRDKCLRLSPSGKHQEDEGRPFRMRCAAHSDDADPQGGRMRAQIRPGRFCIANRVK
jgi:hypothetical protein